jgi:hypothetical protein
MLRIGMMIVALTLIAPIIRGDDLLPAPAGSPPPATTPSQPGTPGMSAPGTSGPAAGQDQALVAARAACANDIQALCPGVQPGGGRILACLKQHKQQVSGGCKQAIAAAMQKPAT